MKRHINLQNTLQYSDIELADMGEQCRVASNFTMALQFLNAAITINPKNDFALASMGEIYRVQNNFPYAVKYLGNALSINPKNDFALAGMGEICRVKNNLPYALQYLTAAIAANPNNQFALSKIALLNISQNIQSIQGINSSSQNEYCDTDLIDDLMAGKVRYAKSFLNSHPKSDTDLTKLLWQCLDNYESQYKQHVSRTTLNRLLKPINLLLDNISSIDATVGNEYDTLLKYATSILDTGRDSNNTVEKIFLKTKPKITHKTDSDFLNYCIKTGNEPFLINILSKYPDLINDSGIDSAELIIAIINYYYEDGFELKLCGNTIYDARCNLGNDRLIETITSIAQTMKPDALSGAMLHKLITPKFLTLSKVLIDKSSMISLSEVDDKNQTILLTLFMRSVINNTENLGTLKALLLEKTLPEFICIPNSDGETIFSCAYKMQDILFCKLIMSKLNPDEFKQILCTIDTIDPNYKQANNELMGNIRDILLNIKINGNELFNNGIYFKLDLLDYQLVIMHYKTACKFHHNFDDTAISEDVLTTSNNVEKYVSNMKKHVNSNFFHITGICKKFDTVFDKEHPNYFSIMPAEIVEHIASFLFLNSFINSSGPHKYVYNRLRDKSNELKQQNEAIMTKLKY